MRSRATSGQGKRSKEDGIQELKGETSLSGAYLRRLVKQLGSSLPKDSTDSKAKPGFNETHDQEAAAQPRKQTRRRVHTSKPYQARIINMAEARKEIVNALKFHRASMKRASEQLHLHPAKSPPPSPSPPTPSLEILNPISSLCPLFSWPSGNVAPQIPPRPLGLNLNLEGFAYPSSSTAFHGSEASPEANSFEGKAKTAAVEELHPSVDEEEMARIISIGEQHDLEWNDNLNSVTSVWWSEFLQAAEASDTSVGKTASPLSFPSWLSDRHEYFDDHCFLSEDSNQAQEQR